MDTNLDQQLLQQFSCMGTNDRDDLIQQFQSLVLHGGISYSTAHFFLEMNNWNLQAAVNSFFDFDPPSKLPSMALVRQVDNHILNLPPSTVVFVEWVLVNNGDETWPDDCVLQFSGGDAMGSQKKITVPALPPQKFAHVIVALESPPLPGIYKSQWRMSTPSGSYFGETIWVFMTVATCDASTELAKQLSNLNTCGENQPNHADATADSNCVASPTAPQPMQEDHRI
ncbi:Chromosome 6 open reading frame 106 [Nesidiocoris tenuis]|uniref:Chromosome 6 open reading frame 106 n=1 Tax=Nesidiocoris tenuis TaxID=355587 RepID=A0ABN7AE59_9HEMI|nr:Chromosome 6 open reading frame 106 [Nesidiocoris tenuis]